MNPALVEMLVGRPLRRAEQAIDVFRLDDALERAKDDLEREIRSEMLRAVLEWAAGRAIRPEVRVTDEMLAILEELRRIGREEAELELERLGYRGVRRRSFVAQPTPVGRDVEAFLRTNFYGVTARIEDELVVADLSGASTGAVAHALLRVPGARDIASRVISTALIDGLGQTWEQNEDLVRCWQYTAILDRGTCEVCAPLDGTTYGSLEELFVDLPDFGPNPACLGGGRCRCRAVPCPVDEAGQNFPPPDVEPDAPTWRQELVAIAGRLQPLEAVGTFEDAGSLVGAVDRMEKVGLVLKREAGVDAQGFTKYDRVPGEPMRQIEQDVLRAGELIEEQIEARIGGDLAKFDWALDRHANELAAARARASEAEEVYRAALKQSNAEEEALIARLRSTLEATRPDLEPWQIFREAREHDEVIALKARHTEILLPLMRAKQDTLNAVLELRGRDKTLRDRKQQLYRGALRDVLEEHRGLGREGQAWEYTTRGVKGAAKTLLEKAAEFYPTDWIERGRVNPIEAKFRKRSRGYHSGGRSQSEILLSDGDRSKVLDDPDGLSTAIHELGHHLEHTDRRLRALEWAFYQRRTRAAGYGEQEAEYRFGKGYGSHETYREDEFVERYMGKTYGNMPMSSHELLTMGLESVWTGSYDLDPEMRRFILGLLAVV